MIRSAAFGVLFVVAAACNNNSDVASEAGSAADAGSDGGSSIGTDANAPADSGIDSGLVQNADASTSDANGANVDAGGVCDTTFSASTICGSCVQEKCADLLAVCQRNTDCACMAACLGDNGVDGVPDCLVNNTFLARPPGFGALEECVAVACPDGDECMTPGSWTPPVDVICEGSAAGVGGGALADCNIDRALMFDPDGAILQLESADGSVCARIVRRNDGAGSLANIEWTLLELQVGPLGQVALIDQATAGCWYSSHHNFRDWIHAWTGTRHFDLVLKLYGHGGARTYDLYAFEQGPVDTTSCLSTAEGTMCIAGPIELFPINP